jgi:hypothetical protein
MVSAETIVAWIAAGDAMSWLHTTVAGNPPASAPTVTVAVDPFSVRLVEVGSGIALKTNVHGDSVGTCSWYGMYKIVVHVWD